MKKVLPLPPQSFIIDEEYGYKNHIWIDEDNNYDKTFNFGSLNFVGSIQKKFGGTLIRDVELCFRLKVGEEWISLSKDNDIPDHFEGLVAIFAKTESGSIRIYDGTGAKWIGIDLE